MTAKQRIYSAVRPFVFGCITGIIGGATTALFLVCAKIVSAFAIGLYAEADGVIVVLCIISLALVVCLTLAVLQTLCPAARGSGIPLAEGCARGILRVKWLRTAAALIAGSLLSFLCGLPLGSEGPSIGVGGLVGGGIGNLKRIKRDPELPRYLITGGASAGLAVAFNAPLTGVAFALEETHRRFSPGILLAAFSAVVPAVLVSQLIFWGLGHNAYMYSIGVQAGLPALPSLAQESFDGIGIFFAVCGVAALCGAVCSLLGVAFNRLTFALGKLFSAVKNPVLRLLPVFALTAVCGLCLYASVGSGENTLHSVSADSALWLLFTLLAIRFVLPAVASGSGATGGLFLPMIAVGGLVGTIAAKACIACGMPVEYTGNIIMLCIAAFFAASVRAPISAMVMAVELTASFANLLPCAIAVAVATAIGGLTRTEPLYEHMMEGLQKAAPTDPNSTDVILVGTVDGGSALVGKRIRDILWPYNTLVTELVRADGSAVIPDGETVVLGGDKITVCADDVIPDEFEALIKEYIIIPTSTEKLIQ